MLILSNHKFQLKLLNILGDDRMKASKYKISLFLLQFVVSISVFLASDTCVNAAPESKTFTVLDYNVSGLQTTSSSNKSAANMHMISSLLNDYDIIAVQEDFAYHDQLIKNVTHPYLTQTSGNLPMGDGMNFISKYPFQDHDRKVWKERSGVTDSVSNQLTPKGFMYAQYELEPGAFVDIYTLQTDAGNDVTKHDNLVQLADYINTNSNGNAVIVMGDTNSLYTRKEDDFEITLLQQCGLKDPWIDLTRGGSIPDNGDALIDEGNKNNANHELDDKIFYRGSKTVTLDALSYKIEDTKFIDSNGNQLSSHCPIAVQFKYTKQDNILLSSSLGGKGGNAFNDIDAIPSSMPTKVNLRWESNIDAIELTYEDGTVLSCGGTNGYNHIMYLGTDEYITEMTLCKAVKYGADRLSYVQLKTNKGFSLSGGMQTNDTVTYTAPTGWYIAGFLGRADAQVYKLGAIYKPLPTK